jgi:SAM-dependent methyltransferase
MVDVDIAGAWSAVAPAWDAHVDGLDDESSATTEALLERLGVQPGERVLELAAGPGSLGPVWSRLVGAHGSVVVSDIAEAMVEAARRRVAGLANVATAVLDASAIDVADASFDVVASRMGLMFTPDPARAFAEIHRVLAPGGRLGALTWGPIERNPWMTCVGMAAMMHGVVSGGPPVGPGGIFSLSDADRVQTIASEAGFTGVEVIEVPVSFHAATLDEHVARVVSLAGPLAAALRAASADQRAALRRTAAELAAPYVDEGGVELPGVALLVIARR